MCLKSCTKTFNCNKGLHLKLHTIYNLINTESYLFYISVRSDSACMQVIASKDALVREYHDELSAKNDNYVKVLQKQDEDTSALIEHMRQVCATNQCHSICSFHIETNTHGRSVLQNSVIPYVRVV